MAVLSPNTLNLLDNFCQMCFDNSVFSQQLNYPFLPL